MIDLLCRGEGTILLISDSVFLAFPVVLDLEANQLWLLDPTDPADDPEKGGRGEEDAGEILLDNKGKARAEDEEVMVFFLHIFLFDFFV